MASSYNDLLERLRRYRSEYENQQVQASAPREVVDVFTQEYINAPNTLTYIDGTGTMGYVDSDDSAPLVNESHWMLIDPFARKEKKRVPNLKKVKWL